MVEGKLQSVCNVFSDINYLTFGIYEQCGIIVFVYLYDLSGILAALILLGPEVSATRGNGNQSKSSTYS